MALKEEERDDPATEVDNQREDIGSLKGRDAEIVRVRKSQQDGSILFAFPIVNVVIERAPRSPLAEKVSSVDFLNSQQ